MKAFSALLLGGLLFTGAASAATINVPADYSTIQAAINAASNGDTVLVAPGTYYEQIDFKGKAITVTSSGGAAVTILDGNNSGPIVTFDTSEGSSSVLQGFTLTHADQDTNKGPAVNILGSSPTIEDNIFTDNSDALGWGGAIAGNVASPIIIRNYFAANSGPTNSDNPVCVIGFVNGSSPTVADNTFVNNSAIAYYQLIPSTSAAPKIYNNTIANNTVGLDLSLASNISGTLFSNNILAFNEIGVQMAFTNGATLPPFNNNLVYGNTTANYQGISGQSGVNGNISVDPEFRGWPYGDIHLIYGSPAIDAGDSSVNQASSTDFYGNPRVAAGNVNGSTVVDIGASEYSAPVITAGNGSVSVPFETTISGMLGSSGEDPTEPLTYALVTLPAHGSVTITNASIGTFQYSPAPGYIGSDSFTFNITDPYGTVSNTATEQLTVAYIPPVADSGHVETVSDTAVNGTLAATAGYPGQTWTFGIVSQPAHGTVSLTPTTGQFRYTPATGFAGFETFTFKVTDSHGLVSNTAAETVSVDDVAPKANNTAFATFPLKLVRGVLSATKAYQGQILHYSLVTLPDYGSVTLTNASTGTYTYIAPKGFRGKDSFTFQVTDQWGVVSNTATVRVTVW